MADLIIYIQPDHHHGPEPGPSANNGWRRYPAGILAAAWLGCTLLLLTFRPGYLFPPVDLIDSWVYTGYQWNLRGHIKTALRYGATPHEVMEVMLQTSVNFGMPKALYALDVFVQIMEAAGRLDEIGNPLTRAKMKD